MAFRDPLAAFLYVAGMSDAAVEAKPMLTITVKDACGRHRDRWRWFFAFDRPVVPLVESNRSYTSENEATQAAVEALAGLAESLGTDIGDLRVAWNIRRAYRNRH